MKAALKPGGFATFQTGVPFYQPWEITDALKELAEFFPQSGLYLTVVPSYIGGFMALSWAGKGKRLGTPPGIKRARAAFATLEAQDRLLQSGHARRGVRAAGVDQAARAVKSGAGRRIFMP